MAKFRGWPRRGGRNTKNTPHKKERERKPVARLPAKPMFMVICKVWTTVGDIHGYQLIAKSLYQLRQWLLVMQQPPVVWDNSEQKNNTNGKFIVMLNSTLLSTAMKHSPQQLIATWCAHGQHLFISWWSLADFLAEGQEKLQVKKQGWNMKKF